MSCFQSFTRVWLVAGAIIPLALPASAADFRLRRAPQSAASRAPAQPSGHVTYIRRLVRDANSAAGRGDTDTARRLAERAHKIAVAYQSSLTGAPDCSPEATAQLAQKFGSTIELSAKRSSAKPSSPPPREAAAASQTRELDLLSMVDPTFRGPQQAASRPAATAEKPVSNRLASSSSAIRRQAKTEPASQASAADSQPRPAVRATPVKATRPTSRTTSKSHEPLPQTDDVDASAQLARRDADVEHSLPPAAASDVKLSSPSSRRAPVSQPIADPEVQSAIGNGDGTDWTFDLNAEDAEDVAEDVRTESQEALLPPAPPAEEVSRARSDRSTADSPIGVWSAGSATHSDRTLADGAATSWKRSTPEIAPASRSVDPESRDPGPVAIETDLLDPAQSKSPLLELEKTAAPRLAVLAGPVIRVREEAAIHWPESSRPGPAEKAVVARSWPLGIRWTGAAGEKIALAIGIALLLGGLALFGLSFRSA